MVDGSSVTARVLHELRQLGAKLLVDDFGTGFSALGYLRRLPVDLVKIDRTFIGGVEIDDDDAALTGALIELTRALGLDLIAEGVETDGEHTVLGELGCSVAQGFLYAAPLAPDEALGFLARE
jgi:EAL domain-containing protein (putative c-di-GMP-specific phosphodiesterase class I)